MDGMYLSARRMARDRVARETAGDSCLLSPIFCSTRSLSLDILYGEGGPPYRKGTMAGLSVLLFLFLLAFLMFFLYRYGRKNKPSKFPRKDLLIGFDSMKGSWSSSSMTKGTGENPLKVVGESHDQDELEEIFRPRTDEGVEKKGTVTIVVEDDNPEG